MIGNPWFALLAFLLGVGLTYLRMAGSATRQVPKPVPRRLVMGGIIPGVVDAPTASLPTDVGPGWTIRAGVPVLEAEASLSPTPDLADGVGEEVGESAEPSPLLPPDPIEDAGESAAAPTLSVQPLEPPWPIEPDESSPDEPSPDEPRPDAVAVESPSASDEQPPAAGQSEPAESSQPIDEEPTAGLQRQVAAGATDEPPTSSWWAAAFDAGDPGPYPGPLRYAGAWPPVGSRVLDVDDEFAAALGAGAAASAASAALFGTVGRPVSAAEPTPSSPQDEPAEAELSEAEGPEGDAEPRQGR
jgi:hypothetical protein